MSESYWLIPWQLVLSHYHDMVESIKGESFLFKWNLNKQILQITKAYTAKYIPCLQGVKYHGLTHKCISKDDGNEN